ncbi:MAG: GAF domain-containing protein [Actinomycetota bacterium]|nr:GAF domain-containing protein [Actinomycetota bacterium]
MIGERDEGKRPRGPVSSFSIILLALMIAVAVFLILVQNVDRFSEFFGGTTFKIITDVALLALISLVAIYIFVRGAEYHKNLESMIERLQKSNNILQVLNAIQSKANTTLDSDRLLDEALDAVIPLTSSLGTIYIMEEETSRLVPRARYGLDAPAYDLPDFTLGEGIVGKVAQSGQPLIDEAAVGDASSGGGAGSGPMFRMALPIKAGNKVMGVMLAGKTSTRYTDEERILLHAVAEVLGNSLTNAKLYDITRRALSTSKTTQSYLDSFIHEANIGVLVVDGKGTVMISNRWAEQCLRLTPGEMQGKNIFDILSRLETEDQTMTQGFRSSLDGEKGVQFNPASPTDTHQQALLVTVFPLFKSGKEVLGAAATFIVQ